MLAQRMDEVGDLRVTLLLNIQRKRGDTSTADDVVRRFADRFWRHDWPGTRRPRVYFDPRAVDLEGPGGVLHAKVALADGEAALVTSANVTGGALERNMELGLLVRGGPIPRDLLAHFDELMTTGELERVD